MMQEPTLWATIVAKRPAHAGLFRFQRQREPAGALAPIAA